VKQELAVDEGVEGVGEILLEAEDVEQAEAILVEENILEALVGENSRVKKEINQLSTKRKCAKKTGNLKARLRLQYKKTSNLTEKSLEEEEVSREVNSFLEDEELVVVKAEVEGEEKENQGLAENKPEGQYTCLRSRSQVLVLSLLQKLLQCLPHLQLIQTLLLSRHQQLLQSQLSRLLRLLSLPQLLPHPPSSPLLFPFSQPPQHQHNNRLDPKPDVLECKRKAMRISFSTPAVRKKRNRLLAEKTEKTP
jgi:hypothetical protein